MTRMREGETEPRTRVRESRFFHSMEEWYFLTREGTVEGPFDERTDAEDGLQTYLAKLPESVN